MCWHRIRWIGLIVAILASWAGPTRAQNNFTTLTPYGYNPALAEPEPAPLEAQSGVAFLDSAVPRTTLRSRFDLAYRFRQPNRAEYFWAQGGPLGPGPFFPETSVDYQEWRNTAELALNPWFSVFIESPFRWVNPDINSNTRGGGDMNFGFKFAFLSAGDWITSFQLRAYAPTAGSLGVGNEHWTVEPGLLVNFVLWNAFTLEGEIKYWLPIDGTDFAGDILRYGLGLTVGQRSFGQMWMAPVAELQGWTVLGGKSTVAYSPSLFYIADAEGTILNACLGVRMGWSENFDWYAGYARVVTGASWQKDLFRLELRYQF